MKRNTTPTTRTQGAEREIVILSCVASRYSSFVDEPRRLNVALTRARRHLIVLTHCAAFERTRASHLGVVIQTARRNASVFTHAGVLLQGLSPFKTP